MFRLKPRYFSDHKPQGNSGAHFLNVWTVFYESVLLKGRSVRDDFYKHASDLISKLI